MQRVLSQAEFEREHPLREMMVDLRQSKRLRQKEFAVMIGFTPQYVCDLELGRRLGSVEFVEKVCAAFGIKGARRRAWHEAGARSHGWDI